MADNENRISGTISIKIDGKTMELNGEFTYNLGGKKRTGKVGPSKVNGYKEEELIPYIEGELLDTRSLDVKNDIKGITNATVTIDLANEKTISLSNAWFAADGSTGTAEANIEARFEGLFCEEIGA